MSKERSSRRAPVKRKAKPGQMHGFGVVQGTNGSDTSPGRAGYRELIQSEVLAAWPQILEGLIKKAAGGGFQQTKLLLDLFDLATQESLHSSGPENEQLCDTLLNNLRLRPRG